MENPKWKNKRTDQDPTRETRESFKKNNSKHICWDDLHRNKQSGKQKYERNMS